LKQKKFSCPDIKTADADQFGRILDNERRQLMTHVDAARVSTGNTALKNTVLLHHLAKHTSTIA